MRYMPKMFFPWLLHLPVPQQTAERAKTYGVGRCNVEKRLKTWLLQDIFSYNGWNITKIRDTWSFFTTLIRFDAASIIPLARCLVHIKTRHKKATLAKAEKYCWGNEHLNNADEQERGRFASGSAQTPLCSAFKLVRQPFARLSFSRVLGFGERQLADLFISKHT